MWFFKFSHILRFLLFFQLFAHSRGLFFPMFENFLGRFNRNNNNNNGNHFGGGGRAGGGIGIFNKAAGANIATGNVTSITVPMLHLTPQRRVDVLTTVISRPAAGASNHSTILNQSISASSSPHQEIQVHSNVTREASNSSSADQQVLSTSQRLIIPTSTSVTSSISASHQGAPVILSQIQSFEAPNQLTLPFTPNLFGMMSYVQALKDIKRNYKDQEKERKIMFHNKEGGDLMTRILRTLIQKVVHKYQKHTEILKLKILKRQDKLQKFLQLPMVSQVIAMDQARAANTGVVQPVHLGNAGAGVIVPKAAPGSSPHVMSLSRLGKPVQSILRSFLI